MSDVSDRFEYEILDNGEIIIKINGREKDIFTQKKLSIGKKEIIEFQNLLMFDISFAYCKKFNCSLDEPKCK